MLLQKGLDPVVPPAAHNAREESVDDGVHVCWAQQHDEAGSLAYGVGAGERHGAGVGGNERVQGLIVIGGGEENGALDQVHVICVPLNHPQLAMLEEHEGELCGYPARKPSSRRDVQDLLAPPLFTGEVRTIGLVNVHPAYQEVQQSLRLRVHFDAGGVESPVKEGDSRGGGGHGRGRRSAVVEPELQGLFHTLEAGRNEVHGLHPGILSLHGTVAQLEQLTGPDFEVCTRAASKDGPSGQHNVEVVEPLVPGKKGQGHGKGQGCAAVAEFVSDEVAVQCADVPSAGRSEADGRSAQGADAGGVGDGRIQGGLVAQDAHVRTSAEAHEHAEVDGVRLEVGALTDCVQDMEQGRGDVEVQYGSAVAFEREVEGAGRLGRSELQGRTGGK